MKILLSANVDYSQHFFQEFGLTTKQSEDKENNESGDKIRIEQNLCHTH